MLIDSHHHLWKYSSQQYGWIQEDMKVLQQDFLSSELRQVAEQNNVDGFVTVQARQSVEETETLLKIAKEQARIWGVVGWVPLADPNVQETIQRFADDPLLKGVRHVVHDEPDDNFILGEDFNRGVEHLHQFGLRYDILIFAKHLGVSIEFVDRHPVLPMVIDHIAKPTIKGDEFDSEWARQFREIAKRDNVTCKFSGVVTEVRDADWSIDLIRPYWDVALEAFTPKRLMFGSDWPVCLLRSSYQRWLQTVQQLASELSESERQDLLASTAQRVYNLEPRS